MNIQTTTNSPAIPAESFAEPQKGRLSPGSRAGIAPNNRQYWLVAGVLLSASTLFLYEIAKLIYDTAHDIFVRYNQKHLEEKIEQNGLSTFLQKIKQSKTLHTPHLLKRLAFCGEHEKRILKHLNARFYITKNVLHEIFKGAHVLLDDGGKTYDAWALMAEARPRISSHPSDEEQYSMQGTFVRELLFSKITSSKTNKTYTWFQLEKYPLLFGHHLGHIIDFIKHKVYRINFGPYGYSYNTHHNPLILVPKGDVNAS